MLQYLRSMRKVIAKKKDTTRLLFSQLKVGNSVLAYKGMSSAQSKTRARDSVTGGPSNSGASDGVMFRFAGVNLILE